MAKNTPRRGASRGSSKKNRQVPGWVWLFTGLAAGLFVAFLVHLTQVQMEQGQPRTADKGRPNDSDKPAKDTAKDKAGKDEDQPKFDFYAVLPKMEVIVPKGEDEDGPSRPVKEAKPARPADKPGDDAPVAGRNDKRFVLQAGSFRRQGDADRRRAELILKGYEVRIQPVKLDNGDTWHRVMIGPYNNINALHRAQDKLAANGVETLPIQLKE
ncbi:SPOR domain-containing protein [Alloalcanivorax gelatiniphagus]|uniref:Cell division protein n=1 Tax=Alloalcanivorax gelatiniphagus TaxID=1194167 RepID=A0ABY2XIY6_9GAMM|nr:SPOR domain-containing protein [Alloalcanivorax gelatiniphagus]TMW11856.1 cell division protein [Alloalcanivorax gelatiniphagus]|tara:strand:+ start:5880 stop:6518 length:639 start_codon:yes stop_codon:yes gene_type:complete